MGIRPIATELVGQGIPLSVTAVFELQLGKAYPGSMGVGGSTRVQSTKSSALSATHTESTASILRGGGADAGGSSEHAGEAQYIEEASHRGRGFLSTVFLSQQQRSETSNRT